MRSALKLPARCSRAGSTTHRGRYHRDGHSAAILDPAGGLIAQIKVPSSEASYATLLSFVAERTLGRRCWALGGTGCYSAGLTSFPPNYGEW